MLIADESAEVAARLSDAVRDAGEIHLIGPANDGLEALQLFDRHRPDAVVLDLEIPGTNGLEVTRTIRDRDGGCLIVIVSFGANRDFIDEARAAGADHLLSKIDDIETLVELIRSL
ncbi:MAG: response regulator transcription factor [Planctomycetes bacterium]|nr:response regulator transcription factor [Planctomycetota bacterium]